MFNKKMIAAQSGFSLIELIIAVAIMVVGMVGLVALFLSAGLSVTRNNHDTTGTMLAETVVNQIAAFNANTNPTTITITDCAGNNFTISATAGAAGTGNGATLLTASDTLVTSGLAKVGDINWTQAQSAIGTGYAMEYVACGTTAAQNVTYQVRWNVMNMPGTMTGNQYAKLVTVSARIKGAQDNKIQLYTPPVTIRTVVGMTN